MKSKVLGILCITALLFAPLVIAGQDRWFTKMFADQSGNMGRATSGVSLIGLIDQYVDRTVGQFSLEPGTWTMVAGQASGTALASTGSSSDSAVSIQYRYGLSNRPRTLTQWELLGTSGTTLIGNWLISGTSHPVPFYPEDGARYIGIFACATGISQFQVPTRTWVVYQ
jgi:hypothetical protein